MTDTAFISVPTVFLRFKKLLVAPMSEEKR